MKWVQDRQKQMEKMISDKIFYTSIHGLYKHRGSPNNHLVIASVEAVTCLSQNISENDRDAVMRFNRDAT
jgi:hypothetical protein